MTKARLFIAAVLVSLAIPAAAQARPELPLAKADHAAHAAVTSGASEWNAELAEILAEGEVDPYQDTSSITSSTVEPCDRDSRYRALCDYEYKWSDNSTSDCTLTVTIGVHGALHLYRPEDEGC